MITNQFFLEILKAVCLSVDWVPQLIQKSFSTKEQKLVQRFETEIVGDTCNASYPFPSKLFVLRIGEMDISDNWTSEKTLKYCILMTLDIWQVFLLLHFIDQGQRRTIMDQKSNVHLQVVQGDSPIKYGPKTLKHPWSIS